MAVNFDMKACQPYFSLESLFKKSEIKEILYYLTAPSSHIEGGSTVKLGEKLNLWNGKQYGNSIEIPFTELKRLVTQYRSQ